MPRLPIVVLLALAAAVLVAVLEGDSESFREFINGQIR